MQTRERVMGQTVNDVVQVDPRTLLVDVNVRRMPALDKNFVDSIREHGVLVPIVAVDDEDGLRVRYGQRRALAAIEAGRDTVPVFVVSDSGDDADRIVRQWAENEHRAALSTADKVAAIEQLALLGVPAGDIVTRTKSSKADVDQALATAKSKLAKKSAERYEFLDLEQAAAVAEFDSEKDTVKALIAAAKNSPGDFAHTLQRARDVRTEAAAVAKAQAELESGGVRILTQRPDFYSAKSTTQRLVNLVDAAGKSITPKGHAKCPGHAAYISSDWQGVQVLYVCLDWQKSGHRDKYRNTGGSAEPSAKSAEAASKERREVLANNKAWRSAESVRRQWLTEFLTRPKPPAGAAVFVATMLARSPYELHTTNSAAQTPQLLGLDSEIRGAIEAAAEKATDDRAQVITLGMVLGAIETSTSVQTWRTPSDTIKLYFAFLTANGYTLSAVEAAAASGPKRRR